MSTKFAFSVFYKFPESPYINQTPYFADLSGVVGTTPHTECGSEGCSPRDPCASAEIGLPTNNAVYRSELSGNFTNMRTFFRANAIEYTGI